MTDKSEDFPGLSTLREAADPITTMYVQSLTAGLSSIKQRMAYRDKIVDVTIRHLEKALKKTGLDVAVMRNVGEAEFSRGLTDTISAVVMHAPKGLYTDSARGLTNPVQLYTVAVSNAEDTVSLVLHNPSPNTDSMSYEDITLSVATGKISEHLASASVAEHLMTLHEGRDVVIQKTKTGRKRKTSTGPEEA